MIANIFYVVLFISFVSTLSWFMLLIVQCIGHIKLPHFLYVILMLLFVVPIKHPSLKWIDPEPGNDFLPGFKVAAKIWLVGLIIFVMLMLLKASILKLSMRKFTRCTNLNILALLDTCAKQAGLKKSPIAFYGTLNEPACIVTCIKPAIVLSEMVLSKLNEEELFMVLLHECVHVKRLHLPLKRLFNLFCCIHWMNPMAWIARHVFSLSCEMDCDKHVVRKLPSGGESRYVHMLMRLMEMTFCKSLVLRDSVGILAFISMKQRFGTLLLPTSKARRIVAVIACTLILFVTVWSSLSISKGVFYPYPSYQRNMEWSDNDNVHH